MDANISANNGSINKAAAGAHGAVDRVANAAASAADDAMSKAKPAIDRVTQAVHQVVDKAASVAAPTADWLSAKSDVMLAAPQKFAQGGRDIVANHPWKVVGAVLALGLLFGRIFR